jgi:hypothetical protein
MDLDELDHTVLVSGYPRLWLGYELYDAHLSHLRLSPWRGLTSAGDKSWRASPTRSPLSRSVSSRPVYKSVYIPVQ